MNSFAVEWRRWYGEMCAMRCAAEVKLSEEERGVLERRMRARRSSTRDALRARIVLCAASGATNKEIAAKLAIQEHTAAKWRKRFVQRRMEGLAERGGRGRKRLYSTGKVAEVIDTTLQEKPSGQTHWSTRTLAKACGVSHTTVNRIWRAHELKPHQVRTFKRSNDKRLTEKLRDIVGLYLNPREHALVLCIDEKSRIQALDRTQPGLPLKQGRCGTMTRDCKRHGTTTLFAALNVLDGKVSGLV